MKKLEWMVAAASVAALGGATYSAGCVKTANDCALLGTCGEGGSGGAGGATSTASASTTSTTTTTTTTGATTTTTTTTSSSSSSGTGGMAPMVSVCTEHHYGDPSNQVARSVHVASNGDTFFAGDFTGTLAIGAASVTATSGTNLFVAHVDQAWAAVSLERFPVSYGAAAYDSVGGTIIAGSFAGPVSFPGCPTQLDAPDNLYVVKLDALGACVWARGFVATGAHVSLALDSGGQIALAGDADANTAVDFHTPTGVLVPDGMKGGGRDIFATILDKDGNVTSAKAFGGPADDVINAVTFDGAGGIVIAGAFKSDTLQITSGGNALKHTGGALDEPFAAGIKAGFSPWSIALGGPGVAQGVAVVGGVPIVAGHFTGDLSTGGTKVTAKGDDLFLVGIKPAGNLPSVVWSKAFLGAGAKSITGFASNGASALALTGTLDGDVDFGLGPLSATKGIYVAKVASANGKGLWSHEFGTTDAFLSAGGVDVDGAGVHVAGSYGTPLDLSSQNGNIMTNSGAADLFVATFATTCP